MTKEHSVRVLFLYMSKKAGSKAPVAMPKRGRKRKEEIVAMLSEKAAKAKGLVFTNYQGLTHQQMESLKKAVSKAKAEYVVTKNRLLLRALSSLQLTDEEKNKFQQPTATLFLYDDIIEPLKHVAKTIKELTLPHIKFGFLSREAGSGSAREGWQILSEVDILKLSSLPPLPVLRAQLLGQLQSPIAGLHRALNWNMQKFVMTLQAISDKKKATSS